MKVLAVIPARAGSKGIPNKNIRMLAGKPLVAYCMENALRSRYITDIIISTDSEEVELIAHYYNIPVIHREKNLCKDDVTLDSVIYNVKKNVECNYVITMQPTSPTLFVDTLDSAVQYAIESDLDTVISVVNKPQLAWVECDGKIKPDYQKRLNRQFLPKRYLETGAFVISKNEVVTENSRIGERVGVYEISDREAIDIDSFQDFLCAEQILRQKKMAIVVNGNPQIGMGHISRMLEFADLLWQKPDFYYDVGKTKKQYFGDTTYHLIPYSGNDDLLEKVGSAGYKLIINDILDTDAEYVKALKNKIRFVVNFEDIGGGSKYADLVINALYGNKEDSPKIFTGEKYYFIPKLFLMYKPIKIKNRVNHIFVCFGGADPQCYTEKVLNIISEKKYYDRKITVVLGKAKNGHDELMQRYNKGNIRVFYNVKNMPELMAQCDAAITSKGRTCFELASLGIPTLALAQNEREEKHDFVQEKNGFLAYNVGISDVKLQEAIHCLVESSQKDRREIQNKMLATDLRKGRERIRNLIDSLEL